MTDASAVPRCVFDCVVLLQAAVSEPAFALLALVEAGRLELVLSGYAIAELRDVPLRARYPREVSILTPDFAEAFLARVKQIGTPMEPPPPRFRLPRDPDDEPYLNLVIHGSAHYLVTRDRDLLDLAEAATDEARKLRRIRPELRILDPATLLRALAYRPR